MTEDRELVARATAGGAEAFRPIVERYQHAVFAIVLSRLRNFHEAQDVAQEVFVEAFQRLGSLRDPGRLGAWLRAIAVNRCIDLLRRNRESLELDRLEELPDPASSPEENLERRELQEQVMAAISRLPQKQRETVALFYINGHSIEDIAALQGAPAGSIKRRLHDARERLKEEMLGMVENTLKNEAPGEEFSKKVFELLSRKGRSFEPSPDEVPEIVAELRDIGPKGAEGLVRALQASDRGTRTTAVWMIRESGVAPEPVVDILKQFLAHTSQDTRAASAKALMRLDVSKERKKREFIPLITRLLSDPARRVRTAAALSLQECGEDVPLEVAVRALAQETDGRVRRPLASLVLRILQAREEKSVL